MHIHLSLRDKLIAVSIVSVIIALVLSTLIDSEIARRAFTQRFRDEAMRVAKELSAGFGGSTELDDWETLVHKIHEIKEARTDIRQINVFARNPENGWSVAASDEDPPTAQLSNQELTSLMRGRTFADEEPGWDAHYWRVITPIKVDKHIIGALQVLISWEAAQQDEAKERRKMLLTLAATVILVSVALTIFVQRAVYRPIKALVGAMQRAQAGSLDVEVVPHGRDELSQLAMHFNRMLGRIRQDTDEKEKLLSQIQQFNEELQGKIQQATRTLEQRNHELQHVNEALVPEPAATRPMGTHGRHGLSERGHRPRDRHAIAFHHGLYPSAAYRQPCTRRRQTPPESHRVANGSDFGDAAHHARVYEATIASGRATRSECPAP